MKKKEVKQQRASESFHDRDGTFLASSDVSLEVEFEVELDDDLASLRDGDVFVDPAAVLFPLLPGFTPAAEFAAATALNKLPWLGRFDLNVALLGSRPRSARRRNGLGRFSSSEWSYWVGRIGIEGLFDDDMVASSPLDFDLEART